LSAAAPANRHNVTEIRVCSIVPSPTARRNASTAYGNFVEVANFNSESFKINKSAGATDTSRSGAPCTSATGNNQDVYLAA
jgi:hypothetical protein